MTSCKKEVSPEIEISVLNENGQAAGARIPVKLSVDGAEDGIINEKVIGEGLTDQFGKVFFELDNTALVNVALFRGSEIVDSTSILAEMKRLKGSEENVYERTLIYRR